MEVNEEINIGNLYFMLCALQPTGLTAYSLLQSKCRHNFPLAKISLSEIFHRLQVQILSNFNVFDDTDYIQLFI